MAFVHHIALSTSDIDRMTEFYVNVFGFEKAMKAAWRDDPETDEIMGVEGTAARVAILHAENCSIELFEFSAPAPRNTDPLRPNDRGYTHFAFLVKDLQAEYDRLTALGVPFTRGPKGFGGMRAVYGRDPEGNLFELLEIAPELNRMIAPDARATAT